MSVDMKSRFRPGAKVGSGIILILLVIAALGPAAGAAYRAGRICRNRLYTGGICRSRLYRAYTTRSRLPEPIVQAEAANLMAPLTLLNHVMPNGLCTEALKRLMRFGRLCAGAAPIRCGRLYAGGA
jgi:hypothetical protein